MSSSQVSLKTRREDRRLICRGSNVLPLKPRQPNGHGPGLVADMSGVPDIVRGQGSLVANIRRVSERCLLNLSRPQASSRWCGEELGDGVAFSGVVLVTSPWFKIARSVANSPRVA
ncbi:hypothetical protein TNCV_3426711 [Trichonephila clavipes]|nr:hypothetical protein TNCV_3426711 [Trichonephila clavipes]